MKPFKVEGLFGRDPETDQNWSQISLCRIPVFYGTAYPPNELMVCGRRYVPADNRPYIEISEVA